MLTRESAATGQDLSTLLVEIEPLHPHCTVDEVGDLFLSEGYARLLSLPIVEDGRPIGIISRYDLMHILMRLYGRELYGKRPIAQMMKTTPLVTELSQSMEDASQYITDNIDFPITEDFVITREGRYAGMGMVVDLLRAMERRLAQRTDELGDAYQHLKASQAQLVQSEKMASLGQMVAGVAHEINTPLGYVRNNVEVVQEMFAGVRDFVAAGERLVDSLAEGEGDDRAVTEHLVNVSELRRELALGEMLSDMSALFEDTFYGIGQVAELVASLKDFSRVDQASVDNVNLNECIDSALTIGKNALKHRVEVIRQYGEIPTVSCAPSQINQVFLNLLTNAAQAMDGRGKVLLKTWADEAGVYASVEDNGCGIPEDVLPTIFDPFVTTKAIGEGTGLGLSICYQIIERHGGQIRVASRPGVGTKFVIVLPRTVARGELKQVG